MMISSRHFCDSISGYNWTQDHINSRGGGIWDYGVLEVDPKEKRNSRDRKPGWPIGQKNKKRKIAEEGDIRLDGFDRRLRR
ncbi:hypothetical protein CDAR_30321 [Caerostris darwini]|uniref:Uncharacterized protein n=1 Tax=Caerostris darwini TaxID=1538125 RepID=A0AAV4QZG3_9ARAC|nr:hypothetical protein CDAR_30321 [Caerostris darwini]